MKQTLIAIALLITSISYGQSNHYEKLAYQYINSTDRSQVSTKAIDPATIAIVAEGFKWLYEKKVFKEIHELFSKDCGDMDKICEDIGREFLQEAVNAILEERGLQPIVIE